MTATVNLAHHVKGAPVKYRHGWIPVGMPEPSHAEGSIGYDKNGDVIRDDNGAIQYFKNDREKAAFLARREANRRKNAKAKTVGLAVDTDLAAKWHHGYIPANAEALAIKEHRKPGSKPGPHAKTLADYKKYHPLSVKHSMTTQDLLAHADAHTAAAKRARSFEGRAKHVAEARSARLVAAKRVTKKREPKPTVEPVAPTMPPGAEGLLGGLIGGKPKVKPKGRAKVSTADKTEIRNAIVGADAAFGTKVKTTKPTHHVPGYEKTLSGVELAQAYAKAKKAGDLAAMKRLHSEAHNRVVAAEKLQAHARKAKELIETQWADAQKDPAARSKFMKAMEKLLPGLKSKVDVIADSKAGAKLKSVEYFKAIVEAFVDHSVEKFIGPIVGSGLAATGLAIFQAKGG